MTSRFFLFYMSCFGEREVATFDTRRNARAVAAYLREHPVAYPLYLVAVR